MLHRVGDNVLGGGSPAAAFNAASQSQCTGAEVLSLDTLDGATPCNFCLPMLAGSCAGRGRRLAPFSALDAAAPPRTTAATSRPVSAAAAVPRPNTAPARGSAPPSGAASPRPLTAGAASAGSVASHRPSSGAASARSAASPRLTAGVLGAHAGCARSLSPRLFGSVSAGASEATHIAARLFGSPRQQ